MAHYNSTRTTRWGLVTPDVAEILIRIAATATMLRRIPQQEVLLKHSLRP
jgi:hypothetical protein